MKTLIKNPVHRFWLTFALLLGALTLAAGCATRLGRNPLEGWRGVGSAYRTNCPFGQAIIDDYQSYIQNLPVKERVSVSDFRIDFFESETSERAVTIKVDSYGTFGGKEWTHVLIYDRANKRIKSMKYVSGHFLS